MKFILLIAVITVVTFISTDGSPLPREEKRIQDEKEENTKVEDNKDKEHGIKKDSKDKETKFSYSEKNDKTSEGQSDDKDKQFFIMVPSRKNAYKYKQYNLKPIPKRPRRPGYVVRQPNPKRPLQYPIYTEDYQEMMNPETGMVFSVPNMMNKLSDQPMFYMPSMRKGQFTNDVDDEEILYQSPLVYQDKDSWNPYLERLGYYK